MDHPVSELLQTAVFKLRNIALLDGGRAFEAELRIGDLMNGGAFRKTTLECPSTRALLRPNSSQPLGTIQLAPIKGGLRVFGRVWASDGIKAMTEPGVALKLQYKPIKIAGDECIEARLFLVALAKDKNVAN